jgi:hypothetical protein
MLVDINVPDQLGRGSLRVASLGMGFLGSKTGQARVQPPHAKNEGKLVSREKAVLHGSRVMVERAAGQRFKNITGDQNELVCFAAPECSLQGGGEK